MRRQIVRQPAPKVVPTEPTGSRTWRRGLPTQEGVFLLVDEKDEHEQLVRAFSVGGKLRVFSRDGAEVTSAAKNYGPMPDPYRSFTAGRRKDRDVPNRFVNVRSA